MLKTGPHSVQHRGVSSIPPKRRRTFRIDLPEPTPEWWFTFLYRFGVSIIAVGFAAVPLIWWGWFNGWRFTRAALITEAVIITLIVIVAETLREEVYNQHRERHEARGRQLAVDTLLNSIRLESAAQTRLSERRAADAAAKRLFDFIVAMSLLLILAPVITLIAFLVKLDSPGAVLVRAERLGRHGQPFTVYRYRTTFETAWMDPSIKPSVRKEYEPRRTRAGEFLVRSGLATLPELFNVLRGEMSVVGPRPVSAREVSTMGVAAFDRLLVRPGLISPVLLALDATSEEAMEVDNQYARYWSFRFDLKLIARSFSYSVLFSR